MHTTTALRRFIVWDGLQDRHGAFASGGGRKGGEHGRSISKGRSRLTTTIDLRQPAPIDGRPQSSCGATSFHFKVTSISRTHEASGSSEQVDKGVRNPAAGYARYIGGEAKVAKVEAQIFARALGADNAREPSPTVGYLPLAISNIGDTQEEQEGFWNASWSAVRKPRGQPEIQLRFDRGSPDQWTKLARESDTPPSVAEAIDLGLASCSSTTGNDVDGEDKRVVSVVVQDAVELAWATSLGNRFGKRAAARMLHFKKVRGGEVQRQLVCEIPSEFGAEESLETICFLVRLLADDLERIGVRYTIVVHSPDHQNDVRNFHIHVVFFPGRAAKTIDGGWTFQLAAGRAKLRPGDIALRLGHVDARSLRTKFHNESAALDVRALRSAYADHCNSLLPRLPASRRFDPRSYAKMGIEQEPASHLGTQAAQMVKAGMQVGIDRENAWKSWAAYRSRNEATAAARYRREGELLSKMDAIADQLVPNEAAEFQNLRSAFTGEAAALREARAALTALDEANAMARSAATRLQGTSARLLEAIDLGEASPREARERHQIKRRLDLARAHLLEIDESVAYWVEDVARYRGQIAESEKRLSQLELSVVGLVERHQERALAAREVQSRQRKAAAATSAVVAPIDNICSSPARSAELPAGPRKEPQRGEAQQSKVTLRSLIAEQMHKAAATTKPSPPVTAQPASEKPLLRNSFIGEDAEWLARRERYEALIEEIAEWRMPVVCRTEGHVHRFTVPDLSDEDNRFLTRAEFAPQAVLALRVMHDSQIIFIKELHGYMNLFGAAAVERAAAGERSQVPKDVVNLYHRFNRHPHFKDGPGADYWNLSLPYSVPEPAPVRAPEHPMPSAAAGSNDLSSTPSTIGRTPEAGRAEVASRPLAASPPQQTLTRSQVVSDEPEVSASSETVANPTNSSDKGSSPSQHISQSPQALSPQKAVGHAAIDKTVAQATAPITKGNQTRSNVAIQPGNAPPAPVLPFAGDLEGATPAEPASKTPVGMPDSAELSLDAQPQDPRETGNPPDRMEGLLPRKRPRKDTEAMAAAREAARRRTCSEPRVSSGRMPPENSEAGSSEFQQNGADDPGIGDRSISSHSGPPNASSANSPRSASATKEEVPAAAIHRAAALPTVRKIVTLSPEQIRAQQLSDAIQYVCESEAFQKLSLSSRENIRDRLEAIACQLSNGKVILKYGELNIDVYTDSERWHKIIRDFCSTDDAWLFLKRLARSIRDILPPQVGKMESLKPPMLQESEDDPVARLYRASKGMGR